MGDHGRELTKENFSSGTSVDADRIASAGQDILARAYSVRKTDLRKRFVPRIFFTGWSRVSTAIRSPFMPDRNIDAEVLGTVPDAYTNPQRAKGHAVPGIEYDTSITQYQAIARTHLWTTAPCILDGLKVGLLVDNTNVGLIGDFANRFRYIAAPRPPGKANSDPRDDVVVQVVLASEMEPERRRFDDLLINLSPWAPILSSISTTATPTDAEGLGAEGLPDGEMEGAWFAAEDLGIPIPAESRIQFSLMLPVYDNATVVYDDWTATPWATVCPQATMTLLYELED